MDIKLTPVAERAYRNMSVMVGAYIYNVFDSNPMLINSFMNQFGGMVEDMDDLNDVAVLVDKFHGVI